MKLQIDVKKTHIKNGKRKDGDCCPIALAVRSVVKNNHRVHVGRKSIEGSYKSKHGFYTKYFDVTMPKKARNFVKRFDDETVPTSKFKPFSFTLTLD